MARDKTERLLNLLIALTAAARPLGREELRSALADHYGRDQSDDAFEKMFERDKDELRSMGIPLETVTNAHNEVVGYRIQDDRMQMPQIELTAQEAAVIAAAAALWTTASVATTARSAQIKLEAVGHRQAPADLGMASYLQAPDSVFEALLEAATTRRPVVFAYRKPGQGPEPRRIEPWGLVSREGHWYLVGHDLDRTDVRVFRLSRIEGNIDVTGPEAAFAVPENTNLSALVRASTATSGGAVRVRAGAGLAVGLRRLAGVDLHVTDFVVPYTDLDSVVADICAHGDQVMVIEDSDVRAAVIAHLEGILG
jgi:predicted DNA-binding transcriptional regulator YafY